MKLFSRAWKSSVLTPWGMALSRDFNGHLGVITCNAKAMELVVWPSIDEDIKSIVRWCKIFHQYPYILASEPLIMRQASDLTWSRIRVDLFKYAGCSYILAYDAFANFPEVEKLWGTKSLAVVETFISILSRHGIPLEVCRKCATVFNARSSALRSQVRLCPLCIKLTIPKLEWACQKRCSDS